MPGFADLTVPARGRAIVAPNNSGKTTFLQTHPGVGWHDQDDLLAQDLGMGAQSERYTASQLRSADALTERYKKQGLNLLVSAWYDPGVVDGFVIIDAEVLRERLGSAEFAENQRQAKLYLGIAREHGIPVYPSFEAATR